MDEKTRRGRVESSRGESKRVESRQGKSNTRRIRRGRKEEKENRIVAGRKLDGDVQGERSAKKREREREELVERSRCGGDSRSCFIYLRPVASSAQVEFHSWNLNKGGQGFSPSTSLSLSCLDYLVSTNLPQNPILLSFHSLFPCSNEHRPNTR